MRAQPPTSVEGFASAHHELGVLTAWLEAPNHQALTHSAVEEHILSGGYAILLALYQGYLDRRSAQDRQHAQARAADTGETVHEVTRPIESIFGEASLARCAGPAGADGRRDFPLDRALNLPEEVYSMPLRQRVAEQVRGVSMEQTVKAIDRTTGAHVPKRQVEELTVRAAQDFDAFYAQRPTPANDTVSDKALLVMTSDSKGVAMIPSALRDATRKKAAETKAKRPAHGDPMAPKKARKHTKRMAIVTAVFTQEPHVRTPQQVVQGLSRTPGTEQAKPPRPQDKVVAASVKKTQKQGIREMFDEGERRDPTHARQAVALVDGEKGQKEKILAEAKARAWSIVLIVDLIHVLSYVWKAAKALCKGAKPATLAAVTEYLEMLVRGDALDLARLLVRQAKRTDLTAEGRKAVARCVGYLRTNAPYMRYDVYLAAGYPLATGVVEGLCRHLVQDRMGITGARWDLVGAEAVLRLRALFINGDWDAYWSFHEQQHARRCA